MRIGVERPVLRQWVSLCTFHLSGLSCMPASAKFTPTLLDSYRVECDGRKDADVGILNVIRSPHPSPRLPHTYIYWLPLITQTYHKSQKRLRFH
ncbi:hypothetical protein K474DRAFT_1235794 [Panus rudis PR-1116 ss-1]|nr:hypothetical protein K474DRAFT_1235794 [Panus rudis PR-1116 ss-1]